MIQIAQAYKKVADDPTLCPMPTLPGAYLTIGNCMLEDEARNPALVEARRREYTEYFKDAIRDLDLMRGFYGVFGRAF